jgi:serine/threonine protein kinase
MGEESPSGRPADRPNQLLDRRYELHELIGAGSTGSVYRAVDTRLDRPVAVKLFHPSAAGDLRRFSSEARTLASLDHPNLVRLLDAGDMVTNPYLVMDLVDGPNLAGYLSNRPEQSESPSAGPALPVHAVARIGHGIASALAYIHRRTLVHRDVKPANVLIGRDGVPRLTDFGIARLLDATAMTATGLTLGTPAYMAPEQLESPREVGPAADVYALGLVLLECLTGERAFPGTPIEACSARLLRSPELPTKLDSRWRDLLGAMTARNPLDRPKSQEAVEHLSALMESRGTPTATLATSPPTGSDSTGPDSTGPDPTVALLDRTEALSGRSARPVSRHTYWAATLGVVLAVVVALFALQSLSTKAPLRSPQKATSHSGATTTTVSATTTSSATTTTTTSISGASAALFRAIDSGLEAGEITAAAAQQLTDELGQLVTSSLGDGPNPANVLDQMANTVESLVAQGQIQAQAVDSIQSALNQLATALGTSVSTTTAPVAVGPGPPNGDTGPGARKRDH